MRSRFVPAALAGSVGGLAGGWFGVGGGIVLVPLLTGLFRLNQHQAHGTSLAIVGATALLAMVVYAQHGNVAWGTAGLVALASVFSARWGARLARRTPAHTLTQAFAVMLVLVAMRLLWNTPDAPIPPQPASLTGGRIAIDLAIGLAVGLLAGYMGVGGGLIAVPAFVLLLGMPQQLAQGTSLAVILVTAPAGALEHHRHGNVAMALIPPFALGAALGGVLASLMVQNVSPTLLVRAFAVFLVVNAAVMWIRSERTRRASARAFTSHRT